MIEEIVIIFLLIVLNGVFSMAEISIVSAKKSRMEELLRKGNRNAKKVIALAENPNKFLSTVQIGITSIGILTGVFGGASITEYLSDVFIKLGVASAAADDIAIAVVVVIITFFSIVIGELLPKRIGLNNAEGVSLAVVRPMIVLGKIAAPFVWLLGTCTDLCIRLLNIHKSEASQVTEDEIKALVEEGTTCGTIEEIEQDIVENVFHIGDLRIDKIMVPRADVAWLDINDSASVNLSKVSSDEHSIYPVCDRSIDNVVGIVLVKDLFRAQMADRDVPLEKCVREPLFISETQKAYQVLETFRQTRKHFGFIVNEYGSVAGIVTLSDIIDELVGDIGDTGGIVRRADGRSWLIDGMVPFHDMIKELEIDDCEPIQKEFNTVAGFMLHHLRIIPKSADRFQWNEFEFEVVDMDGNRIDKVLVSSLKKRG